MTIPVTHITVRNTPPPGSDKVVVGRIYPISPQPEPMFKTFIPEYAPNAEDLDDELAEDDAEVKVVRGRRGRRPKANEAAETK